MPVHLVERRPDVDVDTLMAGLVPPPMFARTSFDGFQPDPAEPSQARALTAMRAFAAEIVTPARRRFRRRNAGIRHAASGNTGRTGIYLDGGFGVGKTHLLAATWHAVPGPKAYTTFAELTQLAGLLGFTRLVSELSRMRLLAIDEFELDDPGDTVLITSLLARLAEAGVRFAATSNTLPDRLGADRFATEDFLREIQTMAERFVTVRIDGPDYRHRGLAAPTPLSEDQVRAATTGANASLDDFVALLDQLAQLHPSRYGALLDGVQRVGLLDVVPAHNESVALRLVVLADRLYDRQLPLYASGTALDSLFPPEMLAGGYRKKYRRAVSRLVALAAAAQTPSPSCE
ncbi:MAG: AFG1-family ATPase [Frankiales bacterium]|nr:AFG1-family ATPase [Frankiales bacterium]